jgi:phenylacetate-CoA ligase
MLSHFHDGFTIAMSVKPTLYPMQGNVPTIAFPAVNVGVPAALAALVAQLDQTQWLSEAELAAGQMRQLQVMAGHSTRESVYFKSVMERAGLTAEDLGTPEKFRRLPLLRRRDIQSAGASLFCHQLPAQHPPIAEVKSSGSTGEPVIVRRTSMCHLFWLAMTLRDHFWHGRDFSQRFTAIRAQFPKYVTRDDWGPPVNMLYKSGPFQAIPISAGLEQQWKWLSEFQPHTLLIYPSNLEGLLQYAQKRGVTLPSVHHIRTIGEMLRPETRELAGKVLTGKLADCYSTQEVGSLAVECPESSLYHICAENLIVEVLDDAGEPCGVGQTGRVVVTDLVNFATPIIRYEVGDYAEVGPRCPCGRGLPTLARILGRERNLVAMPDGTRHWPLVGTIKFREMTSIQQFQFIQHDREFIEMNYVSSEPLTSDHVAALTTLIQECLGHTFRLKFTPFENVIPRAAGGKFEEFICKVPR